MALRKKIRKFTGSLKKISENQYLICKECHVEEVMVSGDVASVICAECVQRMVAPPPEVQQKKNPEDKFPRGWHFKKRYVHIDGKVYVRGILTDEVAVPKEHKAKPKKNKKNVQVTK